MKQAQHTPAPWVLNMTRNLSSWVIECGGKVIASCPFRNGNKEEALANARLIAAAPELLDAARKAVIFIKEQCRTGEDELYNLELAISKAEEK